MKIKSLLFPVLMESFCEGFFFFFSCKLIKITELQSKTLQRSSSTSADLSRDLFGNAMGKVAPKCLFGLLEVSGNMETSCDTKKLIDTF